MMLNAAEIMLEEELHQMGTSLQELCKIAGVPYEEGDFWYMKYDSVASLEIMNEVSEAEGIGAFMMVERTEFNYSELFGRKS
jgi:hypothetical protein